MMKHQSDDQIGRNASLFGQSADWDAAHLEEPVIGLDGIQVRTVVVACSLHCRLVA